MSFDRYRGWSGRIEDFVALAAASLREIGRDENSEPNARLVRDYMSRGILPAPQRRGRESIFAFEHLVRFLAARVLIDDGWPLSKVREHLDLASVDEIEGLIPGGQNRALAAVHRIKGGHPGVAQPTMATRFRERAVRLSSVETDLEAALNRLGRPEDYRVEELTLFAVATWCQVLVESSRLKNITMEEAEDVGRAVTAMLIKKSSGRGNKI